MKKIFVLILICLLMLYSSPMFAADPPKVEWNFPNTMESLLEIKYCEDPNIDTWEDCSKYRKIIFGLREDGVVVWKEE